MSTKRKKILTKQYVNTGEEMISILSTWISWIQSILKSKGKWVLPNEMYQHIIDSGCE